jgi:hypothetical protein
MEWLMGNIFNTEGAPNYFAVPQDLVDSGVLEKLTPSAVFLYLMILRRAQGGNAAEVVLPAWAIKRYTGLHHGTIPHAIKELAIYKLARRHPTESGPCNTPIYQVLNPLTGEPLPIPNGGKLRRQWGGKNDLEPPSKKNKAPYSPRVRKVKLVSQTTRTEPNSDLGNNDTGSREQREQFSPWTRTDGSQSLESEQFAHSVSEHLSEEGNSEGSVSWNDINSEFTSFPFGHNVRIRGS